MDFALVFVVALLASILTFFSGFGLGTILTPVFILFFPTPIAIGLTAIVHLLNNLFKLGLLYQYIQIKVLAVFGGFGIVGSIAGAYLLGNLDEGVIAYAQVSWLNLIIGALFLIFAILEMIPDGKQKLSINQTSLMFGGLSSGFFGGLSGHQGALRSIFLLKYGLNKEAFVATGVTIACFIDIGRLSIYYNELVGHINKESFPFLLIALVGAIIGASIGRQFLKKINIRFINISVGILIALVGIALITGLI